MDQYDKSFYDANNAYAREATNAVISLARGITSANSVVDFGCAEGTWLADWKRQGADEVFGIDGKFVDRENLAINADEFMAADLSQPIELGRRFDLAQSLEVAEHLPRERAAIFVGNLVRHSSMILFSAAPPGQGGLNHINEQPYDYWRNLFAVHKYSLFDCIRDQICNVKSIAPWYRYNTFLYVHDDAVSGLSSDPLRKRIEPQAPIPDISPWVYRSRKLVIRNLPFGIRQALVRAKRRHYAGKT